jgi:hypothetical protein
MQKAAVDRDQANQLLWTDFFFARHLIHEEIKKKKHWVPGGASFSAICLVVNKGVALVETWDFQKSFFQVDSQLRQNGY